MFLKPPYDCPLTISLSYQANPRITHVLLNFLEHVVVLVPGCIFPNEQFSQRVWHSIRSWYLCVLYALFWVLILLRLFKSRMHSSLSLALTSIPTQWPLFHLIYLSLFLIRLLLIYEFHWLTLGVSRSFFWSLLLASRTVASISQFPDK